QRRPLLGFILPFAFVCLVAIGAYFGGNTLDQLLEARVYSRLGQLEDYDEVTLEFLENTPEYWTSGVGLGLVPFFVTDYMPLDPEMLAYMLNYTWDPKAGLLRILASL